MAGSAKEFLNKVASDPEERKKLHDAIAADIVKAGAEQGYEFTEAELDETMGAPSRGTVEADDGVSIGWN
jgi:predicted ribosomally synthesized peptide with nif11-like leader